MPHDPAHEEDTRQWLEKAWDDLAVAEHLLEASPPLYSAAVFHCQQCGEKALKGFLAWHDVPFRKTHELEEIGEACLKIDATLKEIVDRVVPLSEYAWKFRYPGEPMSPSREEVQAALSIARELYDTILARLPAEAKP